MKTTNTGRNILSGVSVLTFTFICLSYIQSLIGGFSYTHSFSIFHLKSFTVIVSSIGMIFPLIKKASYKKFRIWLILLAISSTVDTTAYLLMHYKENHHILSVLFLSELLKAIMCIILACACFFPKKSQQYLLIFLGVLSCSDICLSLFISSQHNIFYEYRFFTISLKYLTPIGYFLLGSYLTTDSSAKTSQSQQSLSINTTIEQGEKTMKYCSHCGKEIMSEAVICPHCGCATGTSMSLEPDNPSTGLNILSFFFPLIGLILFIVFQSKTPTKANHIGWWALAGFLVNVLLLAILAGL